MTDGGVNLLYKDVMDGRTVGPVHLLSDITDRFFEYFLEYAQICSKMLKYSLMDGQEPYRTGWMDGCVGPSVTVTTLMDV
jgi:hypothetical protein